MGLKNRLAYHNKGMSFWWHTSTKTTFIHGPTILPYKHHITVSYWPPKGSCCREHRKSGGAAGRRIHFLSCMLSSCTLQHRPPARAHKKWPSLRETCPAGCKKSGIHQYCCPDLQEFPIRLEETSNIKFAICHRKWSFSQNIVQHEVTNDNTLKQWAKQLAYNTCHYRIL